MDNLVGEKGYYFKVGAWHGKGNVSNDPAAPSEVTKRLGCDIPITLVPLHAAMNGELIDLPNIRALTRGPIPGHDTQPKVLNTVAPSYVPFTNMDLAQTLDPLFPTFPTESAFLLGDGETYVVTLKVGRIALGRNGTDVVESYLFGMANHGNGRGTRYGITTTRMVCQNTMEIGWTSSRLKLSLNHDRHARADANAAVLLLSKVTETQQEVAEQLTALALKQVVTSQVAAIIEAAYPLPQEPRVKAFADEVSARGLDASHFQDRLDAFERVKINILERRDLATDVYSKINDKFPDIAGTAWAAVNAITEIENHYVERGDPRESIILGSRSQAMQRAYATATAFI